MKTVFGTGGIVVMFLTFSIIGNGCGYTIQYLLNERGIVSSVETTPLRVAVLVLADNRPEVEKTEDARKDRGDRDAGDFSYDAGFYGNVAEEISRQIASHLEYSGSFQKTEFVERDGRDVSHQVLDSLSEQGIDAVIAGQIDHFYGYFDRKPGRQMLMGAGFGVATGIAFMMLFGGERGPLGYYDESKRRDAFTTGATLGYVFGASVEEVMPRDYVAHVKISAHMIQTSTGETLWEDSAEVMRTGHRAIPRVYGKNRRHELPVYSLRDVVNELVMSLSQGIEL
jgi:hypothetical protein